MNTFSVVGSVAHVGMLLFLSLSTEGAKLLLSPCSQHQVLPPAVSPGLLPQKHPGGRREDRPPVSGAHGLSMGSPTAALILVPICAPAPRNVDPFCSQCRGPSHNRHASFEDAFWPVN